MQKRRDNLQRPGPFIPETTKEPHDDNGLDRCAYEFQDHGSIEDAIQQLVIVVINSVYNHGDMRPQFGNDVEST